MNKKQVSIKANMVLNAIKTVLNLLFPLITAPYVARILHVENIGIYSFATSFVSYFIIISSSSVELYAIREGSPIREEKSKINYFINEIIALNVLITAIEYVSYFFLLKSVPGLKQYIMALVLISPSIAVTTVGCEWVNSIFEDYYYITIRSIIIKAVSLVLTFVLVRDENDLGKYIFLYVFSIALTSIINVLYSRRHFHFFISFNRNIFHHLKSILYISASTFAIVIYTSFDTIMLGFICNNKIVGLYGVSTKIYLALKSFLSAFIVVAIPRFSYYKGNGLINEFNRTLDKLSKLIISSIIPIISLIILYSREVILILFGSEYERSKYSLAILLVAAGFAMLAYIFTQCVMMPLKKEKQLVWITVISALINIAFNFILIPKIQEIGASITTVMAEAFTFISAYLMTRKEFKLNKIGRSVRVVIVGSVVEILVCMLINNIISNIYIHTVVGVALGLFIYYFVELALKNEIAIYGAQYLQKKIHHKQIIKED